VTRRPEEEQHETGLTCRAARLPRSQLCRTCPWHNRTTGRLGEDTSTLVNFVYDVPFRLDGTLGKVMIEFR
jgi:hypothetical protein